MSKQRKSYILATGEADRQRLTILNRLYNPVTQAFLFEAGLKPGMSVLEIGCGTGHMAVWFAKQVTPDGKVLAIDSSKEQLKIAEQTAKAAQVNNIEFKQVDIRDLATLHEKFDCIYGRWVLEFVEEPAAILNMLYQLLNSDSMLVYETTDFLNPGHFSYPPTKIVDEWYARVLKMFQASNLPTNFCHRCYELLTQLNPKNITIKTNQQVLITPEDKSVFRLGLITGRDIILNNKILTEAEYNRLIEEFNTLEKSATIAAFYRNLIFKAVKA